MIKSVDCGNHLGYARYEDHADRQRQSGCFADIDREYVRRDVAPFRRLQFDRCRHGFVLDEPRHQVVTRHRGLEHRPVRSAEQQRHLPHQCAALAHNDGTAFHVFWAERVPRRNLPRIKVSSSTTGTSWQPGLCRQYAGLLDSRSFPAPPHPKASSRWRGTTRVTT